MSSSAKSSSKIIAERIKRFRRREGLTQHKLALKAGLNLNYVGMIERTEYKPTVAVLEKICKAMGIGLEDLFKGL